MIDSQDRRENKTEVFCSFHNFKLSNKLEIGEVLQSADKIKGQSEKKRKKNNALLYKTYIDLAT